MTISWNRGCAPFSALNHLHEQQPLLTWRPTFTAAQQGLGRGIQREATCVIACWSGRRPGEFWWTHESQSTSTCDQRELPQRERRPEKHLANEDLHSVSVPWQTPSQTRLCRLPPPLEPQKKGKKKPRCSHPKPLPRGSLTSVRPAPWSPSREAVHPWWWPAWHTVGDRCRSPPPTWRGQHFPGSRTGSRGGGSSRPSSWQLQAPLPQGPARRPAGKAPR